MVIAFFLLPLVVVGLFYGVDLLHPGDLTRGLVGSPVFIGVLAVLTLAAILAAAWRARNNPHLASAWLFLFCGVVMLTLVSLIDVFSIGNEPWSEDLLFVAAFFPLLFFAVQVTAPLRLLMITRRQRALYGVIGAVLFLGVCALVLIPWLLVSGGPRSHGSLRHLLGLARPLLDTVLVEPVALLVVLIGIAGGGTPYVLVGIGLVLFIPADVVDHVRLLQDLERHNIASDLLSITSSLYLLGGAILASLEKRRS